MKLLFFLIMVSTAEIVIAGEANKRTSPGNYMLFLTFLAFDTTAGLHVLLFSKFQN